MNKKSLYILLLVLIIAGAVLFIQRDKLGLISDFIGTQAKLSSTLPIVTLAEYQSLVDDISYEKAVSIIGAPGTESSRNKIDGVPGVMETIITVMYMWQNADGSNMNAIFQNNKMTQKAQYGLK